MPGASRVLQRLNVVAAPGLELGLEARSPWRLGPASQADASRDAVPAAAAATEIAAGGAAAADLRAELFSSGQPPAIRLTVATRPPLCSAEACWYALPAAAGAYDHGCWGRLDLRLHVRAGDLDALILSAPFAQGAALHCEDGLFTLERAAGQLVLRARQRWSGEHVLRIEGPFAPDQAEVLPHCRLARLEAPLVDLPLREVVAVQAPAAGDLELHPSPACIPIDADELPPWSQPIPGAALVAARRRQPPAGGAPGGFRRMERTLAAAPAGFIDQLEARTQVSPQGTLSVLRLRVAAPGLQVLPLGLPPGTTLSAATVDGLATAVRRAGAELVLPLPGRTQVEVALLLAGPAPGADLRLDLPRFGELAITCSSWAVAVDSCWLAEPVVDGLAMPFPRADHAAQRAWFSSWQAAPAAIEVPEPPPAESAPPADGRALVLTSARAAPAGEPQLALRGTLLQGSRVGAARTLALRLVLLDDLGALERCGRILALLVAAACALLCSWRQLLAVLAAALLASVALHALAPGAVAALALALCETVLAALLPAAAVVYAGRTRRPRPMTLAALALLLAGGLLPAAEAGSALAPGSTSAPEVAAGPQASTIPLLMGYRSLDPAGLPLEVAVAVSRAALARLWRRAHPDTPAAPPLCALACGAASYVLAVRGDQLAGELSLPLAVLAADWQQLRLAVSPGSVAGVSFRDLRRHPAAAVPARPPGAPIASAPDAVSAAAPAWTVSGGELVVTLAPHVEGELVVALGWPLRAQGAALAAEIPLCAGHGGTLSIDGAGAPELVPAADGLLLQAAPAGGWSAELPPGRERIVLRFQRADSALAHARRVTVVQDLRAALLLGRIEWSDEARIAIQGAALREARLALPAGLAITAVTGQALAAWRQQGAELALSWSMDQSGESLVRLAGILPAGQAGAAGLVPRLVEAGRSSGRLVLVHGPEARFIRPEHPAIERADPGPGSDLALRWNDDPAGLLLSWQALRSELRLSEQCGLVAGLDQVRVTMVASLDGHGSADALRLALPQPWQPARDQAGLEASVQGSGEARMLVLRGSAAWRAGNRVVVGLEAERSDLGERFAVPDLQPLAGGPLLERQEWLLGDAGDRRLALGHGGAVDALGLDLLAAAIARAGGGLARGERWRLACARRPGPPPEVELRAEGSRIQVSASHYLALGQEQLRWWAHLAYMVEQGELDEMHLTLPANAELVAVEAQNLGSWQLVQRELVIRLAAPARHDVAIDLELRVAAGATLRLDAISSPPGATLVAQQVAMVEEDELGLVRRSGLGLEEDQEGAPRLALPLGIDARLVPHLWHALRPDWQLTIAREPLAASAGVDGIATLVDALTVIAPEGDLRGRASWHVLNRTRSQLALALPAGVELWEARVDGELVRPRLADGSVASAAAAGAGLLWLPVRPQRPGETAQRIVLTWRERLDLSRRFTPHMPLLSELRTMQVLWRLVPPAGALLERADGDLRDASLVEAEAGRAHAVIAELQRLHSLGDLGDVAMHRLSDQLGALDLELNDYLVALSAGAPAGRGGAAAAANQAVIGEVLGNRAQLQGELQRIDRLAQNRAGRRKALGLGNDAQRWAVAAADASAPPGGTQPVALPRLLPAHLPWPAPLAIGAGGTLGPGEPPPGFRPAGAGSLLGVDLVGDPGAGGLQLLGSGFAVELSLHATGQRRWPALLLAAAGALLAAAMWRRARVRPVDAR